VNGVVMRNPGELAETVDLARSGVMLIDIQNDFCHKDGAYPRLGLDMAGFRDLAARAARFLARVRQAGVPVIHVGQYYSSWTMSPVYQRYLRMFCNVDIENTLQHGRWGAEFYGINPQDNEHVIMKPRDSAFFRTNLGQVLRCSNINTIILAGMATSGCIEHTARDGFFRDYHVVVLEDCTGDGLQEWHESALGRMSMIGVVTDSQTLFNAWEKTRK